MKRIVIQTTPRGQEFMKNLVSKLDPEVVKTTTFTDSFDHALTLIPKDGNLVVITSNEFHDGSSNWKGKVSETISNTQKNGSMMAKMIKEINPKARVYVFAEWPPSKDFIDGYIPKDHNYANIDIDTLRKILITEPKEAHATSHATDEKIPKSAERSRASKPETYKSVIPIVILLVYILGWLILRFWGKEIIAWVTK